MLFFNSKIQFCSVLRRARRRCMRRRLNTSLENQVQIVFFSTLNCPLSTWLVQHRIILFHSFNIPILKLNFPLSTWLFQSWIVLFFQHDYFKAKLFSLYDYFKDGMSSLYDYINIELSSFNMTISKLNFSLSTILF